MHQGRLRLRPWLEEQIRSGKYPGVTWLDETTGVFQIPWKHAARHGWNIDKDATLFRNWAMHTGKYKPGMDKPDPKTWKANFRCALNSLPDVKELHDRSIKKGNNAFRVYRMLPPVSSSKRRRVSREQNTDIRRGEGVMFPFSSPTPSCVPLADPFRYRESEAVYSSDFLPNRDSQPASFTDNEPQDGLHPFPPDTNCSTDGLTSGNEHTQAVLKIVEHLKNIDHWNESHEGKSWNGFYSEEADYNGHYFHSDYHSYNEQQRPFFQSH